MQNFKLEAEGRVAIPAESIPAVEIFRWEAASAKLKVWTLHGFAVKFTWACSDVRFFLFLYETVAVAWIHKKCFLLEVVL
jgi:hypothetical protein